MSLERRASTREECLQQFRRISLLPSNSVVEQMVDDIVDEEEDFYAAMDRRASLIVM